MNFQIIFHSIKLTLENKLYNTLSSLNQIDSCIHFAGLKAVGESVKLPLLYYHINLTGTFNLLNVLQKLIVINSFFIISTVYGSSKPPYMKIVVGIGIIIPMEKLNIC